MNERKKLHSLFKRLDYVTLILVVIISVIGLVVIASASKSADGISRRFLVQSVAFVIGLGLMIFMSSIDYESYQDFVKPIILGSILLLLFTLIFGEGKEETGSNSWIRFGPIGIQPSELVKIAFAITFSVHLVKVKEDINVLRTLCGLFGHFLLIVLPVILQNDTGTALVFTFMFLVMLFCAGLSYKYIFAGVGAIAVFAPIAWFFLLQPYQKNRFLTFFNPESDPLGHGYQVTQSKIAIGSGEFLGRGYLKGPQTQLSMLPEKETDFIFGVIGEEFGFIGTTIVLLLLIFLICRCLYISSQAKNDLGKFMCIGISAMLLFHTFENICMCVGLMPVTGIPLPFLSYGGSSLITNFAAIGLVMSVWARRHTINFGLEPI
ncbi:MAG: rod shape-determining protein RodA [Clostridia bacterium]|nr:rod shape-determining protein RodA [Clostridia bacterium]